MSRLRPAHAGAAHAAPSNTPVRDGRPPIQVDPALAPRLESACRHAREELRDLTGPLVDKFLNALERRDTEALFAASVRILQEFDDGVEPSYALTRLRQTVSLIRRSECRRLAMAS